MRYLILLFGNKNLQKGNELLKRRNKQLEIGNRELKKGNSLLKKGNKHLEKGNDHLEKGNILLMQNILHITTPAEWRKWLQEHYNQESEAWLVYAKKATGKPRIVYNDAVEEALCFGWIDSINKTYDAEHTVQRFTPRNPQSTYSQPNIERLRWLAAHKRIHPACEPAVQAILAREFTFPADIIAEIQKDPIAWDNYCRFSESYKRIAYIDSARKRPEEFAKRLKNFIDKTHHNALISGFGGIEKYY